MTVQALVIFTLDVDDFCNFGVRDFARPSFGNAPAPAAAGESPGKKKGKGREEEDETSAALTPSCSTFHTATTWMGVQPCVMVGTLGGTLLKYNSHYGTEAQDDVVYGLCCADSEPTNPSAEEGQAGSLEEASLGALDISSAIFSIVLASRQLALASP